ncbi:hypothetical protein SI65_09176 [Aspergillus cristatus]|uniref:F-box domain-containing protein n=1 Tax=Aspergillus cristatus TaxID=573508 RepID=A0A1E3B2P7_ASPCR|nr:hypothetical protein SI65_09176 [Aspergillus cristatus]
MPILALPLEILFLVTENLDLPDLWALYNSCQGLQACSARLLFQSVEIRFDGVYPTLLNSRYFPPGPNRLPSMLTKWSSHVKKINFWGDEDAIQLEFLNILDALDNLRAFRHYQLPPRSSLLSRTFDAAGQAAIIGGAERGLHVPTNMDVPDDIQQFTHIAFVLH